MLDTQHAHTFAAPIFFLKATVKKQVWIPQFTKKNGQVVGGHFAMVHVSDDHDHHKVAGGAGTYSQKKAHAALKDEPGFHQMSAEDQAALVMHHATQIQDAESAAARLATLKKKLLAGQAPTAGEWKHFHAAPADKQQAITEAVHAAGKGALMDAEYAAFVAKQPPANAKPAEQQSEPQNIPEKFPAAQKPAKAAAPAPKPEPQAEPEKPASASPAPSAQHAAAIDKLDEAKAVYNAKHEAAGTPSVDLHGAKFWVLSTGATNAKGQVHAHLANKELGSLQANGFYPKQIAVDIDPALIKDPKKAAAAAAQEATGLAVPEFAEGKTTTGVKKYYEGVASKIIAMASAGDVAGLEAMPQPEIGSWGGKTANSKLLLQLHAAALAQAKGETPAAAAPVDAGPKDGDTKEGADGTLVFKDGRWHKMVQAAAAASTPALELDNWINTSVDDDEALAIAMQFVELEHGTAQAYSTAIASLEKHGFQSAAGKLYGQQQGQGPEPAADPAHDAAMAAANAEPDDAQALLKLKAAISGAKVPSENTNAKAFNPKVDAIIAALEAGDKAALLAMSYGTNTYGKKAAKLANEALQFLGSRHQVAPGQKAGEHPKLKVVSIKMAEPAPAPAGAPKATDGAPDVSGKSHSVQEAMKDVQAMIAAKDAPQLAILVQSMEGLASFKEVHDWAAAQLATLEGDEKQDALVSGWKAAIASGMVPTKAQAEAMDALKQTNGDQYMDEMAEAQAELAMHMGLPMEDDMSPIKAENQMHELHAQAKGKPAAEWYEPAAKIAGKPAVQEMMAAAKKGDLSALNILLSEAWDDGEQSTYAYGVKLKEHMEANGPKDGDTKQGADGMLVFKDGRWHKMGTDPKVLKQKAASVPMPKLSGKNSIKMTKTMKALKAAAESGGAEGLAKLVKITPAGHVKAVGWKAINPDGSVYGANADAMAKYAKNLVAAMEGTKGTSAPPTAVPAAAAAAPAASAAPTVEKVGKITAMVADKWEQTGPQKGSNPGGRFKDAKGQEWYCKFPSDPDTVKNELLASKFYKMLGVEVPELRLVKRDGKLGIASKWVDGLSKGDAAALAVAEGAHKGFVFDAWLANWDVVGLANDNMLIKDGKAVRVDVGGSLIYRAQGSKKGDAFGESVTELDTLLDPAKNANSAAVFGKITPADLDAGGAVLAKMHPNQIDKLCRTFGPGTRAEQEALAAKLVARREFILKKLGIPDPWNAPAPDITKLAVNPADLPPPIDFNNYPGKGAPLSSKKHINDQNTVDDAALIEFAKQGNLKALQDYHYDAYDKETGAYLGKKPIGQHPSKDIKNHHAALCDLLSAIAHPPVEGLDLPPIGGGSIEEVSEAAGYIKPGENINSISSDKVIGFWMKLGHVGADAVKDLIPPKTSYLKNDFVLKAKKWYQGVSTATKALVNSIQDSGAANRFWNKGDKTITLSSGGHKYSGGAQQLASTIYNEAYEFDEGETVGRWMNLPDTMKQQLLKEGAGLVFQNADSMCTSIFKDWGNNAKFGSGAFLNIRFAKGAKAMASLGSGRFAGSGQDAEGNYVHKNGGGEMEVTTLMGQRFVVLGVKKGNASSSDGITLDLLALPPHEGYVAEVGSMGKLGKSLVVFRKATAAERKPVVVFVKSFARTV